VLARREIEDDAGVVHAYDEELAGEAMSGGPVMLAWREVDGAGRSANDGYNVVVHEFAHVIDMRGRVTADAEQADPSTERGRWLRALADEHEGFARRIDDREETFLDPYAAESLEEFFAVAAEAFFVAPVELEAELPRTYELLQAFFRQDPARSRIPLPPASF
jgi:Mlc titration factor MtfA (ptsG expression regulator)